MELKALINHAKQQVVSAEDPTSDNVSTSNLVDIRKTIVLVDKTWDLVVKHKCKWTQPEKIRQQLFSQLKMFSMISLDFSNNLALSSLNMKTWSKELMKMRNKLHMILRAQRKN